MLIVQIGLSLTLISVMGKLHCGMQTQQWNNGNVKTLRKTVRHKDATILHYVHCVSLSIFNVLTQSFSVLKVFAENVKKIDI